MIPLTVTVCVYKSLAHMLMSDCMCTRVCLLCVVYVQRKSMNNNNKIKNKIISMKVVMLFVLTDICAFNTHIDT